MLIGTCQANKRPVRLDSQAALSGKEVEYDGRLELAVDGVAFPSRGAMISLS